MIMRDVRVDWTISHSTESSLFSHQLIVHVLIRLIMSMLHKVWNCIMFPFSNEIHLNIFASPDTFVIQSVLKALSSLALITKAKNCSPLRNCYSLHLFSFWQLCTCSPYAQHCWIVPLYSNNGCWLHHLVNWLRQDIVPECEGAESTHVVQVPSFVK